MKPLKKLLILFLILVVMPCLAYDGPIIDGHAHCGESFNEEAVLDRYAKSSVVAQIVMPRYLGVQGDCTSVLMIEQHFSHLQVIQAIEQLRGANTRKLIEAHSKAADNYPSKKQAERELRAD